MHGFDLEQLKTFVAAVDTGSLTAAVPVRFRSQSALSTQLNKLEESAGMQLLIRSKHGVRPTAAGQRLMAHAREILALSDAAWRDMHDVHLEGDIRIGISDYFQTKELVHLLARVAQQYPRLRMRTQIGKSDDILSAHSAGAVDVAIILRPTESECVSPCDGIVLRTEPLLWVTACDRPIALKGSVVELALLDETCALHRLARRQLDACGVLHTVAHVASGVAGIQAAVAAGLGVACLNASAVIDAYMMEVRGTTLPALPTADIVLLPPSKGSGEVAERLNAVTQVIAAILAPAESGLLSAGAG